MATLNRIKMVNPKDQTQTVGRADLATYSSFFSLFLEASFKLLLQGYVN